MKRKTPTKQKIDHAQQKRRWRLGIIVALSVLVIGLLGAGLWYYWGRVLPNVKVGGVQVDHLQADEVQKIVEQQQSKLSVTFVSGDKQATATAEEVGVTVDIAKTVEDVMTARRSGNVIERVALWQNTSVPLVFNNDPGKVIDYAKRHFPDIFVNAKEPQVAYNGDKNEFEVHPSEPGRGFDIKTFQQALPRLAQEPGNITLEVTSAPTSPLIQESSADEVKNIANERIKLAIAFQNNGQTFYTATPSDIANWIHFEPDTVAGTYKISYDTAKIQQFLHDKVGPTIAAPPIERKVIVDEASGHETVVQEGRTGQQLSDIEGLTKEIAANLTDNKPLTKQVALVEAPFKTVTLTGAEKWIEIDLTRQTLTAYQNGQVVLSAMISSGKAATPTRPGTFYVWSKVASQTMTGTIAGDYFYLPNVKWVSYFDGEAAIHGTYWHSNFGYPMSHGCINMTEANAKAVYDFAPIGTKVVVHY